MSAIKQLTLLFVIFGQLVAAPQPLLAEPSAQGVGAILQWWMEEGGPAIQKRLGHSGFRAARPAVPIWIENTTGEQVSFDIESKSCDRSRINMKAYSYREFRCPTTSGDNWYNIYFNGQAYGVDGGSFHAFEKESRGVTNIFNYTNLLHSTTMD